MTGAREAGGSRGGAGRAAGGAPVFDTSAPARVVRLEGWWVDGFGALRDFEVGGLAPGLTVLLGANEAGKSTHLTFLRYLLFGFPKRTTALPQYDPVAGGRHGGRVTLLEGEERYELWRYRDDKVARLIGPGGDEAGEHVLASLLGHADAGLFRSVFAFGLSELQSFATLTEEGVRQHIFSAGVVGAGRSAREVSRQIGKQLDELLKGTRGKALINDLLRDLELRRAELAAAVGEAAAYGERVAEERRALEVAEELRRRSADERLARARLVALGELWRRWHEARAAEVELEAQPAVAAETLTTLRALAEGLGVRRERLQRRDEIRRAAEQAGRAVSTTLDELGPGWAEAQVRAVDPSIVGRDDVRRWQRRLSACAEADAEARRAETAAAQRTAELESEHEQRASRLPEPPPAPLAEVEAREDLLVRLREVRAAECAAAAPGAGSRRPLLGAAAAAAALAVVFTLVGATGTGGVGMWLAAALAVAVAVALAGVAWGRARPFAGGPGAARERSEDLARRLGLPSAPSATDLDALEVRLRAERTARIEYEGLRRRVEDDDVALGRAQTALDQRRAERAEAAAQLAEVHEEWRRFKSERGFPATLSTEGTVEWLAALDRCREALERRAEASAQAAQLEDEAREWEATARDALAAAGREAAHLEAAGLEQAVTEACAAADRRAELERRVLEAEQELRARFPAADDAARVRHDLAVGDPEVWVAGLHEADARIAELEREQEQAIREHENARRRREELERSADVARLQAELEGLRAELDDAVARYRELRLAQALIDRTLREFMRTRQPAVLAAAGAAFGRVTAGRYTAVLQPEESEDDLRVLGADGIAKTLATLSRGTAEQLYLCLRLGLAREFAAQSVALPFVMDDCLVDFDPERAAAMAAVLVEFAVGSQVVVFTCHPETAATLLEASMGEAAVVEL
ncbi:MAG: AAA family ATPase [Thermoleophilia bacterium]|nr:AAA family ATPase [Thermoleophilia bacterium]